jgi:AcrR family transcriptional regulator
MATATARVPPAASALAAPTRQRIVDEAMRLFGENGVRGTSVAQIEAAAGLSPGAGGLYHHFKAKDDVLAEGIRRHLARLDALRDIRALLTDLGDLRAELAVAARYFLAELDSQSELFRILVCEARRRPELLTGAADQLISSTYQSFADWLQQAAGPELAAAHAMTVSTIAMGALLSDRILRNVMAVRSTTIDDDTIIPVWVDMVMTMLSNRPAIPPSG